MNIKLQQKIDHLVREAGKFLIGKDEVIRLAAATLLANGHLLITDQPGVGKTTLANVIARLFGLNFKRIQFTSDLLPADITGINIFDQQSAAFTFHPGPIFTHLVLADEINRATPKCQSALLEAMEEKQVSIDRKTHSLPSPFFVIATRNPTEQAGTFPLPESQLDRFMLGISIGYPDREAEKRILSNPYGSALFDSIHPLFDQNRLDMAQRAVRQVHVSEALLDYLQDILEFSRKDQMFYSGYSPRAGISILAASRAWALINGRDHVLPEDLQTILPHSAHHLVPRQPGTDLARFLQQQVAVR